MDTLYLTSNPSTWNYDGASTPGASRWMREIGP